MEIKEIDIYIYVVSYTEQGFGDIKYFKSKEKAIEYSNNHFFKPEVLVLNMYISDDGQLFSKQNNIIFYDTL